MKKEIVEDPDNGVQKLRRSARGSGRSEGTYEEGWRYRDHVKSGHRHGLLSVRFEGEVSPLNAAADGANPTLASMQTCE
jgi:hypothetical protein